MISWTIPLNILLLMPHIVIVFGSDCQWESMRVVDQKKCCTAIRCHSNRHWTSKNHLLFSLSLSLLIYIPTVNQTFNLIPLLCTEYAWVVFKPTPVMKSYQILARSLAIATIHQVRDFPNVWYIIHMHIYLRIYIYIHAGVWLPKNMLIREVSEENLEDITMNLQNSHHIMIFPCRGPVQKQRQSQRLQPQGFGATLPVARCSPYSSVFFQVGYRNILNSLDDTCDTYIFIRLSYKLLIYLNVIYTLHIIWCSSSWQCWCWTQYEKTRR